MWIYTTRVGERERERERERVCVYVTERAQSLVLTSARISVESGWRKSFPYLMMFSSVAHTPMPEKRWWWWWVCVCVNK